MAHQYDMGKSLFGNNTSHLIYIVIQTNSHTSGNSEKEIRTALVLNGWCATMKFISFWIQFWNIRCVYVPVCVWSSCISYFSGCEITRKNDLPNNIYEFLIRKLCQKLNITHIQKHTDTRAHKWYMNLPLNMTFKSSNMVNFKVFPFSSECDFQT